MILTGEEQVIKWFEEDTALLIETLEEANHSPVRFVIAEPPASKDDPTPTDGTCASCKGEGCEKCSASAPTKRRTYRGIERMFE